MPKLSAGEFFEQIIAAAGINKDEIPQEKILHAIARIKDAEEHGAFNLCFSFRVTKDFAANVLEVAVYKDSDQLPFICQSVSVSKTAEDEDTQTVETSPIIISAQDCKKLSATFSSQARFSGEGVNEQEPFMVFGGNLEKLE